MTFSTPKDAFPSLCNAISDFFRRRGIRKTFLYLHASVLPNAIDMALRAYWLFLLPVATHTHIYLCKEAPGRSRGKGDTSRDICRRRGKSVVCGSTSTSRVPPFFPTSLGLGGGAGRTPLHTVPPRSPYKPYAKNHVRCRSYRTAGKQRTVSTSSQVSDRRRPDCVQGY